MFMYQETEDTCTLSPKNGYVKNVGDDWWVGAGIPVPVIVEESFQ